MWRPNFTILRKLTYPFINEHALLKAVYSTKSRTPRSTAKLTLISASVGALVGAGYGGYTHYKINTRKSAASVENVDYVFLKEAPKYEAHTKVKKPFYVIQ